MKRIYLLRHAQAEDFSESFIDKDRRLTEHGISQVTTLLPVLAEQDCLPSLLVASPAYRTQQTATIIGQELGLDVTSCDEIYQGRDEELQRIITQTDDQYAAMMLVGHNPGVSHLALGWTEDNLEPLSTCGLVIMDFAVDSWRATPGARGIVHLQVNTQEAN